MFRLDTKHRLAVLFTAFFLSPLAISTALADQVTLSYVDENSAAQTIILDCNTSTADLALAASLVGEDGVGLVHDPEAGCGSLADLATAMATASPLFAANVALALSTMSPADADAIAAAVNAVPGVNQNAVLAAIKFGQRHLVPGPQADDIRWDEGLGQPELNDPPPAPNPSDN